MSLIFGFCLKGGTVCPLSNPITLSREIFNSLAIYELFKPSDLNSIILANLLEAVGGLPCGLPCSCALAIPALTRSLIIPFQTR